MLTSPLRLRARGHVVQGLRKRVCNLESRSGTTLGLKLLSHSNHRCAPLQVRLCGYMGVMFRQHGSGCTDLYTSIRLFPWLPRKLQDVSFFLARCDWCGHQNGCSLFTKTDRTGQQCAGSMVPAAWNRSFLDSAHLLSPGKVPL